MEKKKKKWPEVPSSRNLCPLIYMPPSPSHYQEQMLTDSNLIENWHLNAKGEGGPKTLSYCLNFMSPSTALLECRGLTTFQMLPHPHTRLKIKPVELTASFYFTIQHVGFISVQYFALIMYIQDQHFIFFSPERDYLKF